MSRHPPYTLTRFSHVFDFELKKSKNALVVDTLIINEIALMLFSLILILKRFVYEALVMFAS